jgi:hypothetical protein
MFFSRCLKFTEYAFIIFLAFLCHKMIQEHVPSKQIKQSDVDILPQKSFGLKKKCVAFCMSSGMLQRSIGWIGGVLS